MSATRGIQFLERSKIDYEIRRYDHLEKGAKFASQALDFPVESTIKTLVVLISPGGPAYILMPGDKEIPLKKLAKLLGARRAEMADAAEAERFTGYLVGGISPFGAKRRLPTYMEESLITFDKVAINAGQRGIMVVVSPRDIVSSLGATVISLCE